MLAAIIITLKHSIKKQLVSSFNKVVIRISFLNAIVQKIRKFSRTAIRKLVLSVTSFSGVSYSFHCIKNQKSAMQHNIFHHESNEKKDQMFF